ncbi:MAG: phosphoribosylamine--glycine ligase [Pseudomonadota bacterium]
MNILLIGSGGREHALAWKIAQSPLVKRLICAPGNPGMAAVGECLTIDDPIAFARQEAIDLVVVGPEQPLAEGLADRLMDAGIPCFGPCKDAAQLETSKAFTKEICAEGGIPTARYGHFTDADEASAFLETFSAPYVVKADGLAAGKGVVIAETLEDARTAIPDLLAMSGSIIIEEFLDGREISLFAITDGENVVHCGTAQDYKRAHDGDAGPNTGGMGCVAPVVFWNDALEEETYRTIIEPTIRTLKQRGLTYRGVLYAGLMLTQDGVKLLEYNCRFGDPECQLLMRRCTSDLVPVLLAAAKGTLSGHTLQWTDDHGLLITYATQGYPEAYEKGSPINRVHDAGAEPGVDIFHAGTAMKGDQLVAQGGRVLSITALGKTAAIAQERAYKAAEAIDWDQGFYRTDIGKNNVR